ncbi:DUF6622 family protein [Variovorax sp. YR216]|uniref:DUF6622 family protein n=1 Tax=Variovorax sp. YR216 TaxID=1882828 RepID=UPI00089840C9|nr:DUF6622 family protein [Variovorax sp. YR216]SEA19602.1 hypothetical protein SAMN05444680_101860 [Variovorax sp. YR216]
MLTQILLHTPKWVFGLFALLLWLGARQLIATSLSMTRMTLMPIVMGGLSIYGVASAFGDSIVSLLAWAAVAFATLALVLQRGLPAGTRYDAAARRFHVAGTAVPLALMMGIFFTKYIVGVLLAMHPGLMRQPTFAIGISALYGAFTGIFIGRAIRLLRLAMRTESSALAA